MKRLSLDNISPYENCEVRRIWWLNIGCERYWSNSGMAIPEIKGNHEVYLVQSMETLLFLTARSNDIVILSKEPEYGIVEELTRYRGETPRIEILEEDNQHKFISERIYHNKRMMKLLYDLPDKDHWILMPFGVTKFDVDIEQAAGIPLFMTDNMNLISAVNSKIYARKMSQDLGFSTLEGYICKNAEEIESCIENFHKEEGFVPCVIKEPYSASGKGLFWLQNQDRAIQFIRFFKKRCIGECILEKWCQVKYDLNYQLYITKKGDIFRSPLKRQFVKNGVYEGGCDIADEAVLSGDKIYECVNKIGHKLYHSGYWGILSIDAIMDVEDNLIPVIEINGRLSLSSYFTLAEIQGAADGVEKCYKYYNILPNISLRLLQEILTPFLYREGTGVIVCSYYEGKDTGENGRLFLLYLVEDLNRIGMIERVIKAYIVSV